MADKATAESVNASIRPPDYRGAVQILRTGIKKLQDAIAGKNGDIAKHWATITGKGCNKLGARLFKMLDQVDEAERIDAWRTLNGMADVAEWPETIEDLADQAEGKVVQMRRGPAEAPAANDGEPGGDTIEGEEADEELNPDAVEEGRDEQGFHDSKLSTEE